MSVVEITLSCRFSQQSEQSLQMQHSEYLDIFIIVILSLHNYIMSLHLRCQQSTCGRLSS